MNVSWKTPLIPHITKDLTPRSSFAPKARILLKAKEIVRAVRLSPLLSTQPPVPHLRWGAFPTKAGRLEVKDLARLPHPTSQSAIGAQFVKPLIPRHIPASFPTPFQPLGTQKPQASRSLGVAILPRGDSLVALCPKVLHYVFAVARFLLAMAPLRGPLRVRALVWVR